MRIKDEVYISLTPSQRVAATFEALGRGDEKEVKKLKQTCKFKNYRQRDSQYADVMEYLFGMAVAVECDLRGCLLGYLMFVERNTELAIASLTDMANINCAWETFLEDRGIPADVFSKMQNPLKTLTEGFVPLWPEPEANKVAEYVQMLKEGLPT